ncbi:MAG: hypothetical protein MUE85_00610 [Microscillaceae bacterium]|jgi:hypothetical protein|nr:hypothetical protein [Microscillaceae bacterium]
MKNSKKSNPITTNYFQKQWQTSIDSQILKFQNWQGDNWLFVADWSDNYTWDDGFLECNFSYPASLMWEQINDLAIKQKF